MYGRAYSADLIPGHVSPNSGGIYSVPLFISYRGTSELVEDTKDESSDLGTEREGSEDEGPGLEDEGPSSKEEDEAAPEGQQQEVLTEDTTVDEPLGLGYVALRRSELVVEEGEMASMFEVGQSSRSVPEHEGTERVYPFRQPTLVTWVDLEDGRVYTDIPTYVPPTAPVQTPTSPEWSFGSLPVSPSSPVVPTLIASPMTTPAATIAVDEDEFLEVRAVRDEIFSQWYSFRSLEQEQERATVTFSSIWRPTLALEA
ncbi:hypothetical protein Tco_0862650 [Tanacetum coccineum]